MVIFKMAPSKSLRKKRPSGFTLLEVIAVLVIIGILAAVAVGRMTGRSAAELSTQVSALQVHLRYAQIRAMNNGDPDSPLIWGITCDGSQYWLFNNGDIGSEVRLPGEEADRINIAANITVPSFTVGFDYYGRPLDTPTDPDSLRSSDLLLVVSADDLTETIRITRNTGFIP